ncbi:homing endonuclease associated repeat-containing protein [Halolamina rubra]|uniref:homing endonuclease associated repeat-containing protein n=1 Tax=Halolamina rubra TaxID=1380430 RepID=UPI0006795F78|nr:hypothetical protein [Halolamina rubra]
MADEQDCLDALREAAARLGHSPSKAEYEDLGRTPASATIIRTVGGWNEAKKSAGLSTNASTGSRVGPPPEGVDDEIRERWAELSVDQRWHYRNREWNTERTLNRRGELQSWVDDQSTEARCARCNESHPACLVFHHLDADEKSKSVSQLVVDGVSRERLCEEIEKCEVLCANCHREEHSEDTALTPEEYSRSTSDTEIAPTSRAERRAWVDRYKRERGCRRCGHGVAAALVLHHVDGTTKEAAVSRLVSDGASIERVRTEVKKCTVLCANCHRTEHDDQDGERVNQ